MSRTQDLTRLFRGEGQFTVLSVLVQSHPHALTPIEVSKQLPLSTSQICRVLHDLVKQGVVETVDVPLGAWIRYRLDGTNPIFHEVCALVKWEAARREKEAMPTHATDAVFMALGIAEDHLNTIEWTRVPGDGDGRQIDIKFAFLASPYRLTIDKIPDDDPETSGAVCKEAAINGTCHWTASGPLSRQAGQEHHAETGHGFFFTRGDGS